MILHSGDPLITLRPQDVAAAAALIIIQGLVSVRLSLGLHSQLIIAAIRCVIQLSLLGYILLPIFDYGQVCLYAVHRQDCL